MPAFRIPVGILEEQWSEFLMNSAVIGAFCFSVGISQSNSSIEIPIGKGDDFSYLNTYLVIGVLHKWRQHFSGEGPKIMEKIDDS